MERAALLLLIKSISYARKVTYGLYDMSGNVWQWMENKYDNEHDWRALRGGSWYNVPLVARAAHRVNYGTAGWVNNAGFRLARTLP